MSDQKMLELAAKAAGLGPILCYEAKRNCLRIGTRKSYRLWRPLSDDKDCMELCNDLELTTGFDDRFCGPAAYATYPTHGGQGCDSYFAAYGGERGKFRNMAKRRAIVGAAAEMGKQIKEPGHA
ncbi:hypothetical protein D3C76_520990 [compost metagenome]